VSTLLPEMAALGFAVAFTSPGSVATVIVLLSMSAGLRRGIAFIVGWLLAILGLALLMVFVLQKQDFSSRHTTPSQAVSIAELVLGVLLLVGSWRFYRRPRHEASPPKWLDRLDRTPWLFAVAVGAVMLSYTLTLVACAEILKANVSTFAGTGAALVFALTSIVTIAAPVAVVIVAPERSAEVLASWKARLLAHSHTIALILLMVVGVFLIVRAAYDLIA
jgi:Sap-like sulfolipid-1-addressing protein